MSRPIWAVGRKDPGWARGVASVQMPQGGLGRPLPGPQAAAEMDPRLDGPGLRGRGQRPQAGHPPLPWQIISALEEDPVGQKMQLACRLQQVAALVENKVTDL